MWSCQVAQNGPFVAAGVELLRFGETRIAAQFVREAFANDIKLALEFLLAEAVSGRYEELLYSRLCRKRRRSNVSTDRIGWDVAPANERLTFFFYYVVNRY